MLAFFYVILQVFKGGQHLVADKAESRNLRAAF